MKHICPHQSKSHFELKNWGKQPTLVNGVLLPPILELGAIVWAQPVKRFREKKDIIIFELWINRQITYQDTMQLRSNRLKQFYSFANSKYFVPISPRELFRCCGYQQITHVRPLAAWRFWYRRYLHEIDRKWGTGNSVVSMLLHWYSKLAFVATVW